MADETAPARVTGKSPGAEINTELAKRRTGMAFQRTRLAADRTLMAVIRTSLSLIGFGFTIFQFFSKLQKGGMLSGGEYASRRFGESLVWLGIGMLVVGIVYHVLFMLGLRRIRTDMKHDELIHGESIFPTSLTLIVALILLAIGFVAIFGMSFHAGPLE